MKRLSLKKKLLIIFVILFSIPITLSLLLLQYYSSHFTRNSSELLNMRNIESIGKSVEQYFNSIYDFSLYLSSDHNILEFLTAEKPQLYTKNIASNAQNAVSLLPLSNETILSISIEGYDERYLQSGISYLHLTDDEKKLAENANGSPVWTMREKNIYLIRLLRKPNRLKEPLGFMKIQFNSESLKKIFSSQSDGTYKYVLVNGQGSPVYSYNENSTFDAVSFPLSTLKLKARTSTFSKEHQCFLTVYPLEDYEWYLYSLSSNTYSSTVSTTLWNTLILSMIICFFFCLMLSLIFSNTIVAPLKKLGNLMKSIEDEDFSVKFLPKGNDEIAQLALQFDKMSEKLNVLYNQVYLNEIHIKEMQLSALQAQINPHFLYNTLDTIYWMSEFHNTSDVSNMIGALSKFFRFAITGDDATVPLSTEIEHLKCYLYIQQIRHPNDLSYNIQVLCKNLELPVLKLILQPLVENAIIHGIEHKGQGHIEIVVSEENGCLLYKISDTANTADLEKINRCLTAQTTIGKQKKLHIGLSNIQNRIKLRYGSGYGVTCSVEDCKTVFQVKLPLTPNQNQKIEKE